MLFPALKGTVTNLYSTLLTNGRTEQISGDGNRDQQLISAWTVFEEHGLGGKLALWIPVCTGLGHVTHR